MHSPSLQRGIFSFSCERRDFLEDQESRKKCVITVQKNSSSRVTVETRFLDIEKSNSKTLLSNDSKCKTITRG